MAGKAYQITETIYGRYYYPRQDGQGETSETPRPLKDGEVGEWVLLDGVSITFMTQLPLMQDLLMFPFLCRPQRLVRILACITCTLDKLIFWLAGLFECFDNPVHVFIDLRT